MRRFVIPTLAAGAAAADIEEAAQTDIEKMVSLALGLLAACSSQSSAPSGYSYEAHRAPVPQPERLAPTTPTEAHHVIYTSDLQAALARKGYYHGKLDGDCGPETRRAIAHYQHDLGIPVTGHCQVGDKMWSGLGLSAGDTAPHEPAAPR